MGDRFTWSVAWRDLRYSLRQTLLTIGVVAISVTLIIFLNALIGGLQRRLISSVTGSIPHVVVKPAERAPLPLWEIAPEKETRYTGQVVKLEQQKRKIEDWRVWLPRLERYDPNILAVSPVVEGQGILARGTKRKAITATGLVPEQHNRVVELQSKLVQGRFFGLGAGEAVIGYQLADEFSIRLGDKVRFVSAEDRTATLTVAGIFDTGFNAVDSQTLFMPLRDAQSLFGLGTAVTSLGLKLERIFEAEALSRRLARQIPYETKSWMRDNQTLLTGLRAQSQSSNLILFFTTMASGFGIASILIMSVMNRQREIGILKAMGATRRQIIRVFTLEGTLLASFGACLGAIMGSVLCHLLFQLRTTASATGRQIEVFPMDLRWNTVLTAVAIAVLVGFFASLYPAWRAARTNPVEVIR